MLDRTKSPSLNVGLWGKQGQALLSPGTEILYLNDIWYLGIEIARLNLFQMSQNATMPA
jgi:hypothetical protein